MPYTDLRIHGNRVTWQHGDKECLFVMDYPYHDWEIREWLDSLTPEDHDEHYRTELKMTTFTDINLMYNPQYF